MNWGHLVFEAYCCRKMTIKKDKYFYKVINGDFNKTEKVLNSNYDPKYRTPQKPKYCKDKVCYTCWENNCPHLATVPVGKEEHKMFMKAYDKFVEYKE